MTDVNVACGDFVVCEDFGLVEAELELKDQGPEDHGALCRCTRTNGGDGFSSLAVTFGRMFDHSFPPCTPPPPQ